MVIFLNGTDTFSTLDHAHRSARDFGQTHPHAPLPQTYDLSNSEELTRLRNEFKTQGLFASTACFIVKDPYAAATDLETLLKESGVLEDRDRTVFLVAGSSSPQKGKRLTALLSQKPVKTITYDIPQGGKLLSWIRNRAQEEGVRIETNAIERLLALLTDRTGRNKKDASLLMWNLHNEIQKLSHYALANDATIRVSDVNQLVLPRWEANIFALTDAVADRNTARAISTLHQYLEEGMEANYIFSMLVYQFRTAMKIGSLAHSGKSESAIATGTRLHPFVISKAMRRKNTYTSAELRQVFGYLAHLEREARRGNEDMAEGITRLICNLNQARIAALPGGIQKA